MCVCDKLYFGSISAALAVRKFAVRGFDYSGKIFGVLLCRSRCIPSTIRSFCYELRQFYPLMHFQVIF